MQSAKTSLRVSERRNVLLLHFVQSASLSNIACKRSKHLQQQCQVSTAVWFRVLKGIGKRHEEVESIPQPMPKKNLRHILA